MLVKRYDFRGGKGFIRHAFVLIVQSLLLWTTRGNKFRFFTEGNSYIEKQIKADGLFENGAIEILDNICVASNKNGLFIDIGANIGNHSVGLAGNFSKVLCFEPHPVLSKVLEANLLLNNIRKAEVHSVGLGKGSYKATLVEYPKNHGLSKVKNSSNIGTEIFGIKEQDFFVEHEIEICDARASLLRYQNLLDRALIKIDVEGMEGEILESIFELVKKHEPILAFEWVISEDTKVEEQIKKHSSYHFYQCVIPQSKNWLIRHIFNFVKGRQAVFSPINLDKLPASFALVIGIPKSLDMKTHFLSV